LQETDIFSDLTLEELEINMYGIDVALSMMEGPNLTERRRKELVLARLMAITIEGIFYTGDDCLDNRIETARDMVREFRDLYPEAFEV
jgi:hypothetical protein